MKTYKLKPIDKKTKKLLREFILLLEKEEIKGLDSVNILSQYAHRDQKRKTGEPYFIHPLEVSNLVKKYYPTNQAAYYSALLHDAMEDGIDLGNFEDENELMHFILDAIEDDSIASEVIEVVSILTKTKNEPYDSYMSSVVGNPTALIVKLADMLHNLSDNPSDRQRVKYSKAVQSISDSFQGKPSFINSDHWRDILEVTS